MRFDCSRQRRTKAFTLMELLMVMGTSLVVIGVLMGTHLYGLRLSARIQVKLGASDDARETVSMLIQDIRSAKSLRIGTGTATTFTQVGANTNQVGDAIQLYPTTSTTNWVRYFYDSSDNTLKRTVNGAPASLVTANSITNSYPLFTQQNFLGGTLTNRTPVGVIEVNLSFVQLSSPLVKIGPGNYFDFYQLQTRVCPRTTL